MRCVGTQVITGPMLRKVLIMQVLVIIFLFFYSSNSQEHTFPDNFKFGVATASYQVEGAWNVSGKGENIWDRLTHQRSYLIADGSNGDIACDTYSKTKEDVQLLKKLGVDFYRFSISWSRMLPSGHTNKINPDGLRYYNELIDELLANGIEPYVTMYHWDLPQPLHEIGGWPNPVLVDIFVDYAEVLYESFGDRVKNWITFNEPIQVCEQGYSIANKAPAYTAQGIGGYLCGHTLLLAHGRAYRLYDQHYRKAQGGRVAITIETPWLQPVTDAERDKEAAETAMQVNYGWYAHPIFSKDGDYPPVMKERIRQNSIEEGFPRSRLPEFSEEEVQMLRGSSDFLGLNHYSTSLCMPIQVNSDKRHSQWYDAGAFCYKDPTWEPSASSWLKVVPWGFRSLLNWIKKEYNNPEVIVTENGFSDRGELNDCRRVNYYNSYLTELLKAIHEDGCKVTGYTAWSFMDNFEWMMGYTERFGLHHVDFTNPSRPRVPKMSSYVYTNIMTTKRIDWNFTPEGFPQCEWEL